MEVEEDDDNKEEEEEEEEEDDEEEASRGQDVSSGSEGGDRSIDGQGAGRGSAATDDDEGDDHKSRPNRPSDPCLADAAGLARPVHWPPAVLKAFQKRI